MVAPKDLYLRAYNWSYRIGCLILEADDGEKLLKRLLYDLRGEDLPGKFREALVNTLFFYSTAKGLEKLSSEASIPRDFFTEGIYGDRFYYLKAAILSGLLNSLASLCGRSRGE